MVTISDASANQHCAGFCRVTLEKIHDLSFYPQVWGYKIRDILGHDCSLPKHRFWGQEEQGSES